MHTPVSHRRAFTLVELMIVVGIIGTLAAISIPVVMNALSKARNAAIKSEVDMLHMAIMNYRNQVGAFPPLDTNPTVSGPAQAHLKRAFPRCTAATQLADGNPITPFNALRSWLRGFTNDPVSPLAPTDKREPLYSFDASRFDTGQAIYFPSKLPQSPFVYIPKNNYGTAYPPAPLTYTANNATFTIPTGTYESIADMNPDTFQILCAGRDGEWGTEDDISNFWSSTRGDP